MEKQEKIDVRGALRFTLDGVALKLQPSFLNLQRVETATPFVPVFSYSSAPGKPTRSGFFVVEPVAQLPAA